MAVLVLVGNAQAQATPPLLNQWGSFGTGPGQFQFPYGAAVGSDGSVYVTDQYNYRIEQFGPMGDFVRAWGSNGTGPGQFGKTIGICVAPSGQVYVADFDNSRVQVFTSDGGFIRSLAGGMHARDVIVAANGDTYVLNASTTVEVFDSIGRFRLEIGRTFIQNGTSLTLGSDGELLVSDVHSGVNGIWRFDPATGAYLGFWPMEPLFGVGFGGVHALCAAPNGNIYVCDYPNAIVGVLSPGGSLLGQWVLSPNPGQIVTAADVAAGPDGSLYVVDLLGNRIVHYSYGPVATRNKSWGALKVAYH
jgi:DNA-binding beta-propeller fold protein YncE